MNIEVRRPESEDRSKIRVSSALTFNFCLLTYNLKLTAYRSFLLVLITLAYSLAGFSQKIGTPVLTQQFDDAGEILRGYEPKIKEKIALVDKSTGSKIYLLTAHSYAPEIILNYADGWKDNKNKGILMVINPWDKFTSSAGNWDKNARIEVSADLDQKLPEEVRQLIIKEIMTPLLDQNDLGDIGYYSAIMKGLDAIMARWNKPVVPLPVITFVAASGQKYGFDAKTNDALAKYYRSVPNNKTLTYIPWKAIEANQNDFIDVTWDSKIKDFDQGKLIFSTSDSKNTFSSVPVIGENRRAVTLQGSGGEDETEIFASYPTSDTTRANIAQLNVVAYQKLIKHLVIVPLPNAKIVLNSKDVNPIRDKLNKIYGQAVADWSVDIATYTPENWDPVKYEKVETGDGGLLSNYASEMRSINKAFKRDYTSYDENTYYIFLTSTSEPETLEGYMPRAKQFGYVFTEGRSLDKIIVSIAHELGHGAFHLKHTFVETAVSQSTSDNLMDYRGGVVLNKYQWDFIHDPVTVIGILEKEEDAAMFTLAGIPPGYFNEDGSITFLSPSGLPVVLPEGVSGVQVFHGLPFYWFRYIVSGTLFEFTIGSDRYQLKLGENGTYSYQTTSGKKFISVIKPETTKWGIWALPYAYHQIKLHKVKLSTTTTSGDNGTVAKESGFPIKYPSDVIESTPPQDISTDKLHILWGDQQLLTQDESEMFAPVRSEAAFIPVLKIAQLRNMYPNVFNDFCNPKFFNDYGNLTSEDLYETTSLNYNSPPSRQYVGRTWDKYVIDNSLQAKFNQDKSTFYLGFITELLKFIDSNNKNNGNFWATLSEKNNKSQIMNAVQNTSEDEIANLSGEKVILAISIILRDSKIAYTQTVFEKEELAIIRLVHFSGFKENILEKLQVFSKLDADIHLLRTLIINTDDKYFIIGNDNYTALFKAIIWQWLHSSYCKQIREPFQESFHDVTFFQHLGDIITNTQSLTVRVETRVKVGSTADIYVDQDLVSGFVTLGNISWEVYPPFEPIVLINNSKVSTLDEFCGLELRIYPAVLLAYADDKGLQKFNEDVAEFTLDAVSIATGGGALLKGGKILSRVVAASDFLTSTVNMADNFSGKKLLPPSVRDAFAILNVTTSVVDIGSNLMRALRSPNEFGYHRMPTKQEANTMLDEIAKIDANEMKSYLLHTDGQKFVVYIAVLKKEAQANNLTDISNKILGIEEKWGKSFDDIASSAKTSKLNPNAYLKVVEEIGSTTFLNINKLPVDILAKIKSKGWSNEVLRNLNSDLASDALRAKFTEEAVDAWKLLQADAAFWGRNTGKVEDLENVGGYLKNNPSKLDELADGFAKAKDKRKWLDELEDFEGGGYLKEYETVNLAGILDDGGAGKIVYNVEGNPNICIGKQRESVGNSFRTLNREIAALAKLKWYGLPVTEVIGKTRHNGVPSVIMTKYAVGSRKIVNKGGVNPKIIGSSPLLNERSIGDLKNIRAILIEKKIHVSDLQFLIGEDGRVVISDPFRIIENADLKELKKGLQTIDLLIEVAQNVVNSRKVVDDFVSFLSNKGFLKLKNKFNLLDEVAKTKFLDDFGSSVDDVLIALDVEPELVEAWKTIKYCGDDDLAKLATNLEELGVVAKKAGDIKLAGGFKAWKALRPTRLVGGKNIYRASSQEYSLAKKSFKEYREGVIYEKSKVLSDDDLAAFKNEFNGRNLAKVEGYLDGVPLGNDMRISGERFKGESIFDSYKVDKSGDIGTNGAWSREWDTEYVMLSEIAQSKGAAKGNIYPGVTGEVKIISELPYCVSCQGVIQDFSNMFPNVDVILIDALK